MRGNSGTQYKHNLRVIGIGDKYTWQNTANGYVSPARFDTYEQAAKAADEMAKS